MQRDTEWSLGAGRTILAVMALFFIHAGLAAKNHRATKSSQKQAISGRVIDVKGEPVKGAVVSMNDPRIDEFKVQATTDADGQFKSDVEMRQLERLWAVQRTEVRLVCSAMGHGFDFHPLNRVALDQRMQLRLVEDFPVRGRIVDLEGRPVAGADIAVINIFDTPAGLDDFIAAVKGGHRNAFSVFNLKRRWNGPLPGEPKTIRADDQGRFSMNGIGAQRLVSLVVSGKGIENKFIHVMTRDAKPMPAPRKINDIPLVPTTIYGAAFVHSAGPGRRIFGVVRDRQTGKPIAGAKVRHDHDYTGTNFYVTGKDGRYELHGLPKMAAGGEGFSWRPHVSVFEAPGPYFLAWALVQDEEGLDALRMDFDLLRGMPVRGRVTDASDGKPVSGRVSYEALFPNQNILRLGDRVHSPCAQAPIQPDGSFQIPVLPGPGILVVQATEQSRYTRAVVTSDDIEQFFQDGQKRSERGFLIVARGGAGGQRRGGMFSGRFNAAALINPKEDDTELVRNFKLQRSSSQ